MVKQQGTGGLFAYGRKQLKEKKELKLFPSIEDINPQLKKGANKRRG